MGRPALEQPLADESLQRLDLLADRRLRVRRGDGSAAEGALAGDSFQGCEMTELDAEPTIRFHDRSENNSTCANA